MHLQESAEMYLETIHVLSQKNAFVRSIDVADYMGYSKPSVSRAVSILKKNGYVIMNEDSSLSLTESGKEIAEKIYERHNVLSAFLVRLGVEKETAAEDACKMEHVISDSAFEALKKFVAQK